MPQVFTKGEIELWCDILGNDPFDLISKVALAKQSGEPITVNQIRRSFKLWNTSFPDHVDPVVGNALLTPAEVNDAPTKELAEFTVNVLKANNAAVTDKFIEAQYPRLAELLK